MKHYPQTLLLIASLIAPCSAQIRPGFESNILAGNDDRSTALVPINFDINFSGNLRNSLFVNNNGNVTFTEPLGQYSPSTISLATTEIIAPFFADVDTSPAASGKATYGPGVVNGRTAFGVNWLNVGYYNSKTDKLNSFQLVLIDRSDIAPGDFDFEFNYGQIQWETGDASGGTNGLGGDSARVGYSNGDGNFFSELPGSGVNGALVDGGSNELISVENGGVPGRLLVFVRNGSVVNNIGDDGFPVAATLRQAQLSLVHVGLNDTNSRLYRLRTRRPAATVPPVVIDSGKGGTSEKDSPVSIAPSFSSRWEVFGSIHSYHESVNGASIPLGIGTLSIPLLPDYDIDIYGGTVGIEYTLNSNWALGAALIGNSADVDMGTFGDIDTDGYAIAAYASYYRENAFGTSGDWYADLLVSYGDSENDIKRTTFGGIAKGSTNSDSYTLQLSTGYNIQSGSWIHGPLVSLGYTDGDIDGYTETGSGAATFPDMEFESLLGRLGYKVSKVINTSHGTIIPQAHIAWEHEFENDQATIGTTPLGVIDEDRLVFGTGIAWEFSEVGRALLSYEGRFADDLESHQVSLRFGYKF